MGTAIAAAHITKRWVFYHVFHDNWQLAAELWPEWLEEIKAESLNLNGWWVWVRSYRAHALLKSLDEAECVLSRLPRLGELSEGQYDRIELPGGLAPEQGIVCSLVSSACDNEEQHYLHTDRNCLAGRSPL